jgi:hypothetical protein
VWFVADNPPAGGWLNTPPTSSVLAMSPKYYRAKYKVTESTPSCLSNCVDVIAPASGSAQFWRSFTSPGDGLIGVNVSATYSAGAVGSLSAFSQPIAFVRPQNASATNLLTAGKLTQPSNIIASPTNCVVPNAPNATCPVSVTWAALTSAGVFSVTNPIACVRNLLTNSVSQVAGGNAPTGNAIYQIAAGEQVQFFLGQNSCNSASASLSSEIRGVSERLDDPAYTTLSQPNNLYTSPNQNTYAGTGAGQGGTSGGQASYSIPIQMAPGRRGMQPSVSLNHSRAGAYRQVPHYIAARKHATKMVFQAWLVLATTIACVWTDNVSFEQTAAPMAQVALNTAPRSTVKAKWFKAVVV